MKFERSSGIILHPTSLPDRFGIGEIGPQAISWLSFLKKSGCRLWQVLPLGPTGYGDFPYQCFSAFAGNHYLISTLSLIHDGLLSEGDLDLIPTFPKEHVDYGEVIAWKEELLDKAYLNFTRSSQSIHKSAIDEFTYQNSHWVHDYALFMVLKELHHGAEWTSWEIPLRDRHPGTIAEVIDTYQNDVYRHIFRQYLFHKQWQVLHKTASDNGISIIGDVPIFIAHDSADVWTNRDLFYLDDDGQPVVVAGVPPDYFSPTGQRWGNPLFRWEVHKEKKYAWWINRLKSALNLVDIIRLDHFRGFAGYWEVPAEKPTAEIGRWVQGPGGDFFNSVRSELGQLPLIAEDLGEITPDVTELRDRFDLPGMKILQFSFDSDSTNPFLPHNFERNCVVYTGTHDNDTSLGWYQNLTRKEKIFPLRYLGLSARIQDKTFVHHLIRAAWQSVAVFALAPMQDFLTLDSRARMNLPGRASGNWSWRMSESALTPSLSRKIMKLNEMYNR